jgi:hypothetical protein
MPSDIAALRGNRVSIASLATDGAKQFEVDHASIEGHPRQPTFPGDQERANDLAALKKQVDAAHASMRALGKALQRESWRQIAGSANVGGTGGGIQLVPGRVTLRGIHNLTANPVTVVLGDALGTINNAALNVIVAANTYASFSGGIPFKEGVTLISMTAGGSCLFWGDIHKT